jgi:hypothetical protein
MNGIERHELEQKQARLAALKAQLVGKIGFEEAQDITYWYAAVHDVGCPNCGVDFREFSPETNLYPHFKGMCARCEITGNPVGTDTWQVDHPCSCSNCRKMAQ